MKWIIPKRSNVFREAALARQVKLTKPAGALGLLEDVAVWLADVQQTRRPQAGPASAIVFAADHPVSHLGVSAYPREVTPMMIINLAMGGAAASVLARLNGIPLHVVDVGAERYPIPETGPGIYWNRVDVGGTAGDLVKSDAMDSTALAGALEAGADTIDSIDANTRVVIFGEMGIGNTTPASAISARLLGLSAKDTVGPGTGLTGNALNDKRAKVQKTLDRTNGINSAMEVLRCLGGREIAAIVGAMGRAAEKGMAILVDGFIVSSAALVAVRHDPRIRAHMWFSHRSAEPGHAGILESLCAKPLVDAGLRLGEGSGALATFPLVEAAVSLHNQMATFEEAAVPERDQ